MYQTKRLNSSQVVSRMGALLLKAVGTAAMSCFRVCAFVILILPFGPAFRDILSHVHTLLRCDCAVVRLCSRRESVFRAKPAEKCSSLRLTRSACTACPISWEHSKEVAALGACGTNRGSKAHIGAFCFSVPFVSTD